MPDWAERREIRAGWSRNRYSCLSRIRDVWNIPVMEKVIKERFNGKYPARKSIQTNFAHVGGPDGLQFQADAVAYCG